MAFPNACCFTRLHYFRQLTIKLWEQLGGRAIFLRH